jgi:hypothetical protein
MNMKLYDFRHKSGNGKYTVFKAGVRGYFAKSGWTRIRPAFKNLVCVHVVHEDGSFGAVSVVDVFDYDRLPLWTHGKKPTI